MKQPKKRFRSRDWFDDPHRMDMVALYLERWMNSGFTPEEFRSGRPIIGIAQSGSDLNPCNRVHLDLVQRVKEGIRDAGGVALSSPPTRCSRIAGGRRPPSTATSPIWGWSKSFMAIPSTRWC